MRAVRRRVVDQDVVEPLDRHYGASAPPASAVFVGDPADAVVDVEPAPLRRSVRMVPTISTWSGMMFVRLPPWMLPIETTAGCLTMLICRLTIVCRPITISAAVTTMGSTPDHGSRAVGLAALAP